MFELNLRELFLRNFYEIVVLFRNSIWDIRAISLIKEKKFFAFGPLSYYTW